MKIKDVIARTGLTDKAVRLYIENELITPYTGENYTGRRSFDFSEENVQQLRNIATLRKAGFSLAEIKALQLGDDNTRETLRAFILHTREDIEQKTLILQRLEPLLETEDLSVEMICSNLEAEVETGHVPQEDLEKQGNRIIGTLLRIFYIASSFLVTVWNGLVLICTLGYNYHPLLQYRHPKLASHDILSTIALYSILILSFLTPLSLFLISILPKGKRNDLRTYFSPILFCAMLVSIPCSLVSGFFQTAALASCSSTEQIAHYLDLDRHVFLDNPEILDLFPNHNLSSSTNNPNSPPKYHYWYGRWDDVEYRYEIYAEWQLSEEVYLAEKERILQREKPVQEIQSKGSWQCIHFEKTFEGFENASEAYLSERDEMSFELFAYNDSTQTVRYYIGAFDDIRRYSIPYCLSLDWS